jgi:DNA-binding HxlR family transcriptional regulator
MSSYEQFCPVSKASEVFAERWTPLVIRELLMGSHRFNDLRRGLPTMSPTLLSQRLKSLEAAGIIESREAPDRHGHEYFLTEAGEEFRPIVLALGEWGTRWARSDIRKADRDPALLMWDMRRRLNLDRFPPGRTVVLFEFTDAHKDKRRWWLIVGEDDVDLCLSDPGFEVDLRIVTRVQHLIDVWSGERRLVDAIADGTIVLEGERRLQRALPSWLLLSVFATVPRPRTARPPAGRVTRRSPEPAQISPV